MNRVHSKAAAIIQCTSVLWVTEDSARPGDRLWGLLGTDSKIAGAVVARTMYCSLKRCKFLFDVCGNCLNSTRCKLLCGFVVGVVAGSFIISPQCCALRYVFICTAEVNIYGSRHSLNSLHAASNQRRLGWSRITKRVFSMIRDGSQKCAIRSCLEARLLKPSVYVSNGPITQISNALHSTDM
jgi:hypothetical protein